jgi:hypothetical protein
MPGRQKANCRKRANLIRPGSPKMTFIRLHLICLGFAIDKMLTGRKIENVQIVGGGDSNGYLNQMTANAMTKVCWSD